MSAEVKADDRVLWVPGIDRAHDRGGSGEYAWVWQNTKTGEELDARHMGALHRLDPAKIDSPLVNEKDQICAPVRPRKAYEGVVRAVRPDGSADLDIRDPNGCATMHHDAVAHNPGKAPDTFHLPEEA